MPTSSLDVQVAAPSVLSVLVPLVLVAAAGVVHLPEPLHGDAALYQSGARAMANGQVLYRDFWDLKQPGIYLFHLLAGTLFSFTEVGLHAAELTLLLLLSAGQVLLLGSAFREARLAAFVPLASVGAYYGVTTDWHLTQPAILLSVPLFTALVCLAGDWRGSRLAAFVAGIASAIAIGFKFIVAPLVLALLLVAVLLRRASGEPARVLLRRDLLPWVLGLLIVLLPGAAWLHRLGALEPLLWTHMVWRPDAVAELGWHTPTRIVWSGIWFVGRFAPWLLLAAFAPLGWRGIAAERFQILAAVWLVLGTVLIALEPFAGWQFDFLMLAVPTGMLAVRGAESIATLASRVFRIATPLAAALLVLAASAPGWIRWAKKADRFVELAFRPSSSDQAYQRAISERYDDVWRSTAFLRDSTSRSGQIYVFGDPLVQLLAGRQSASKVHGWAWELQPAQVWRDVTDELVRARPSYVYTEPTYDSMIRERAPELRQWLDAQYAPQPVEARGRWYALRSRPDS